MGRCTGLWPHLHRWLVALLYLATFAILAAVGAVAIYATYYYFLIPAVALRIPLYFDFSEKSPSALIDFHAPHDEIDLRTDEEYDITIELEMPESEENRHLGMFMISVDLISVDGTPMIHSHRPARMRYYSSPIRLASILLYMLPYLTGLAVEKQRLLVPLVHRFRPSSEVKAALLTLKPQKPDAHIQVYSAQVHIDTNLRGFRYFAYHWFIGTTIVSVASLQFILFFALVILCWGQMSGHLRSIRVEHERRRRVQHVGEAERAPAAVPAVSRGK